MTNYQFTTFQLGDLPMVRSQLAIFDIYYFWSVSLLSPVANCAMVYFGEFSVCRINQASYVKLQLTMTNLDTFISSYPDKRVKIKCDICVRRRIFRKTDLMQRFSSVITIKQIVDELMDCPHKSDHNHPCGAQVVIRIKSALTWGIHTRFVSGSMANAANSIPIAKSGRKNALQQFRIIWASH